MLWFHNFGVDFCTMGAGLIVHSCESETIEFVLETYFVLNHQRIH